MKRGVLALFCVGFAALASAADCPPPCPAACSAKYCVPVPATKATDKVIYDDRCVDYCLPQCSLWTLLGCGCCDNGCLHCGHPHTRHVLIKKVVHEECPDVQCEVREAPCGPPCAPCR